jgi:hypothetical protein
MQRESSIVAIVSKSHNIALQDWKQFIKEDFTSRKTQWNLIITTPRRQ